MTDNEIFTVLILLEFIDSEYTDRNVKWACDKGIITVFCKRDNSGYFFSGIPDDTPEVKTAEDVMKMLEKL